MTAVEFIAQELSKQIDSSLFIEKTFNKLLQQAKEMEKKQLFLAASQSAKEAYKAGQETMECGCYAISDAQTYEDWLYSKYKSDDTESK